MTAQFSLRLSMRNLAIITLAFMSPLVFASTLQKINVSQLPGDKFEVRLAFDEAPPEPKGYTIEKPARIVLDFPDVDSSLKERRIPLTVPNGQSAMVLTSEGRTRLIVNLDQLASYTSRQEGSDYILEVGSASVAQSTQSGSGVNISNQTPVAASRRNKKKRVRKIYKYNKTEKQI